MYHPKPSVKLYDPKNPEYEVVNLITQEAFENVSPHILYWPLDYYKTNLMRDSVDEVYGEVEKKEVYLKPFPIVGYVEVSPIIAELSKLGLNTNEEINLFVNIQDIVNRIGDLPKAGDIFKIHYIQRNVPDRTLIYRVSTISETDMYNWSHINIAINAEQINIEQVPANIKNSVLIE